MMRSIFAVLLLVSLVSAQGQGYKKKIFMRYAMGNMWEKCVGKQATDKYVLEWIKAANKCSKREFDSELQPVYIKPYPVEGGNYIRQSFNNQPFQQFQQPQYQQFQQQPQYQQFQQQPQYQQFQQQPQYQQQYRQQQQQYRQPQQQFGFQQQQPFYAPGVGFQQVHNQVNSNQVLNRQVRQAGKKKNQKVQNNRQNQVVAGTNAQGQGEAELYYYNKLKNHMTSKVGNLSCIMHELGYFTEDNQVDLAKYKKTYTDLTTIPVEMKEEFVENIDLCQEVSECLPEKCFQKYPYGAEYGRSFFFVMCEKKKAMEVCLKKQMVDDYHKYKDLLKDEDIQDDLETHEDIFSMF